MLAVIYRIGVQNMNLSQGQSPIPNTGSINDWGGGGQQMVRRQIILML